MKFGVYDDDLEVFDWFRDGAPEGRRSRRGRGHGLVRRRRLLGARRRGRHRLRLARPPPAARPRPTSRRCSPSRARSTSRTSTADELGDALDRLLATGAVPDGLRRLPAVAGGPQGHDLPAHRPLRRRGRAGHPRASTAPAPLTRHGGRARRARERARRVRRAQGGGRPLRHVRRRAGRAARAPARRGRRARRRLRGRPRPARPRPARATGTTPTGDAAALRVLVDQVASLTDVRALALHRRWCRPATT